MRHFICLLLLACWTLAMPADRSGLGFMIGPPETAPSPPSAKSLKKGLFLSALVPGAGQLYSGSKLKAAAFAAAEIAGWTLFVYYSDRGDEIEDEFHRFADQHWIEDEYWDWVYGHAMKDPEFTGTSRSDLEAMRDWEHDNFSHGLHRQKDQQYYEMIGKYDQFNYGWDDSDIGLLDPDWNQSLRSERRLYYEERRDASNRALKKATTGVTFVLLNHILSAAEAAWSIKVSNDRAVAARLDVTPLKTGAEYPVPALTVTLNW